MSFTFERKLSSIECDDLLRFLGLEIQFLLKNSISSAFTYRIKKVINKVSMERKNLHWEQIWGFSKIFKRSLLRKIVQIAH